MTDLQAVPRHRGTRRLLASALAILCGLAGACDTIGQDLGDLTDSLTVPTPREAALMAADPDDPDRRRTGTLLLANAPFGGNPAYLALYRDRVQHERDPLVRSISARALARHGAPEDGALLTPLLKNENELVRWEAAKGLQRLHWPDAVPDMLAALRNVGETSEVRVAIARGLGQYPEDRVFQGLLAALDARELAVNIAAQSSLETLTGSSLGLDPRAWLNWYDGVTDEARDPFEARQDFLYPTFQRDRSWLERLAFWSSRSDEVPGTPAGLGSSLERSTYEEGEQ